MWNFSGMYDGICLLNCRPIDFDENRRPVIMFSFFKRAFSAIDKSTRYQLDRKCGINCVLSFSSTRGFMVGYVLHLFSQKQLSPLQIIVCRGGKEFLTDE